MKRAFFISVILHFSLPILAQERACTMPEVSIVERRFHRKKTQEDSLPALIRNQVLQNTSGIYLRANGVSGSSGLSIRGASPAHSEISWNGLPFNNPMLGQADASLLSDEMLRHGRIRKGGNSENGFTGSFGGSLLLESDPEMETAGAETGFSTGSFSQMQQWTRLAGGSEKIKGSLRLWNQSGLWNYPYQQNGFSGRMQHAARNFHGLESSASLKLNHRHSLSAGLWSQRSDRELPAVMFEENALASQEDENHRFFVSHQLKSGRQEFTQLLGFSDDVLHYRDSKAGIDSRAQIKGSYYRINRQIQTGSQLFTVQGHLSRQDAFQGQSENSHRLNRAGMGFSSEMPLWENRLLLRPGLRGELWHFPEAERRNIALLPSLSILYGKVMGHSLEWGIYRKMRAPGLNDLYWPHAGNPELKAEKGFSTQLDWKYNTSAGKNWTFQQQAGIYLSKISSYILWQPKGYWWKPENAGDALLQGITWKSHIAYRSHNGFHSFFELETQLSKQVLIQKNTALPGPRPLPFSPDLQASGTFGAGTGRFEAFIKLLHNGSRPTGLWGDARLPAFQLLDAGIKFRLSTGPLRMEAFFHANNLLNTQYRLLPAWPMPGRNFNLGISMHF